ncbi:MAG: Flp family type IVb pilin [Firmicutes bacterium]|nr:Flp family type IVb pilin [Bacillota bacterium]
MAGVLRRLVLDESGQWLTEYALILVLVAVIAATAVALVGVSARGLYGRLPPWLSGGMGGR